MPNKIAKSVPANNGDPEVINNYLYRNYADINECNVGAHNCSGLAICENGIGFFRCTCTEGYSLDDSRTSCIGKYCMQ